jgi:DNA-binding MarR family transcriptional regulator
MQVKDYGSSISALIEKVLYRNLSSDEYAALSYLKNNQGKSNAILRSDLAAMLGVDIRTTRAIVKSLIEKHGVPIAASQTGYYVINTESERQKARADLLSRARSLEFRALALDSIKLT